MTVKEQIGFAGRGQTLMAAGGIIGALAASSCCILPVALFSLGIGGAWIGNFTQLAPYQPYFIAATLAFIGTGYWLVYRSSKVACAAGEASAHRRDRHRHCRVDIRLRRALRAVVTNGASK